MLALLFHPMRSFRYITSLSLLQLPDSNGLFPAFEAVRFSENASFRPSYLDMNPTSYFLKKKRMGMETFASRVSRATNTVNGITPMWVSTRCSPTGNTCKIRVVLVPHADLSGNGPDPEHDFRGMSLCSQLFIPCFAAHGKSGFRVHSFRSSH